MASEAEDVDQNKYSETCIKGGTIFLVDCRKGMFSKFECPDSLTGEEDSGDAQRQLKFQTVIMGCKQYMFNTIKSKENEFIGVVFFGTEIDDPKTNTKNVTLLIDLNLPSADNIKILDHIIKDNCHEDFLKEYGSSEDCSIADALWFCSSLFSKSGMNLSSKRILLFTDDGEPHKAFPDKAFKAWKRAEDLKSLKVKLKVYPIGYTMEYDKFYKELVKEANGDEDDEDAVSAIGTREELVDQLKRLQFSRRCYARLKLTLGEGLTCGFSLYSLFKEAKGLPTQSLNKSTNQPVKSFRQTYHEMTGELLLPSDITEFVNIGGNDVVFTSEDKAVLKKVMEPGLTLLGFKDASDYDEGLFCGNTSFLYPEESLVKGSKVFVKTLVEQCLNMDKVLLCAMTPRNGALTRYAYLYPNMSTDEAAVPTGFHVVLLPFGDDVREINLSKSLPVDSDIVQLSKHIIKKLNMKGYKTSDFKNPKLERLWTTLQALAMEYEMPISSDGTIPDVERQAIRLGDISAEFVRGCDLNNQPSTSGKKRSSTSSKSPQPKRSKPNSEDDDDPASRKLFVDSVKMAIKEKKVDKFTVVQLKRFLNLLGVNSSGKRKMELVEEVYNVKFENKTY